MGRAERRAAERRERIENRKGKLVLSRKELSDIKKEVSEKTSNFDVEALMTCFALAEHRLYGFGQKRIMKSLSCIDELMGGIIDGTATIQDYIDELEESSGVKIKAGGDDS